MLVVPVIPIAAPDRSSHDYNALEFAKCCRIAVDRFPNVHQRSYRDQRNFARIFFNLLQQKIRRVRMRTLGEVSFFAIEAL